MAGGGSCIFDGLVAGIATVAPLRGIAQCTAAPAPTNAAVRFVRASFVPSEIRHSTWLAKPGSSSIATAALSTPSASSWLVGEHRVELGDEAVSHDRDVEARALRGATAGFDHVKCQVT